MALDLIVEWDDMDGEIAEEDLPKQRIPVTDDLVMELLRLGDRDPRQRVHDWLWKLTGVDAIMYRPVYREDVFGG